MDKVNHFFLDRLVQEGIRMYLMLGNHDIAYKNTNRLNSPELVVLPKYGDMVTVINQPTTHQINDSMIASVPWINSENESEFDEFLRSMVQEKSPDLMLGHFPINGFINQGITIQDAVPYDRFDGIEQVISGHFHTPGEKGNILYPGSPYEFTWADYGQKKGFLLFNTITGELKKVLTKSHMFYKIVYDDSNEFEVRKIMTKENLMKYADKFIKVIARTRTNKTQFETFLQNLYQVNPFQVQIVESDNEFQLSDEDIDLETKSTIEVMMGTVDQLTFQEGITQDAVKQILNDIYLEAQNLEV
jgi:DNA repair exonuclease SbcCD nuclease subunit